MDLRGLGRTSGLIPARQQPYGDSHGRWATVLATKQPDGDLKAKAGAQEDEKKNCFLPGTEWRASGLSDLT